MTARPVVILLMVALLASGCAMGKYQAGPPKDSREYYLGLHAQEIAAAIAGLEKLTAESRGPAAESCPDCFYFLALLYSHPDNPAPDYEKAQASLERYQALAPAEQQRSDTRYLSKLLSEINVLTMMATEKDRLAEDNAQLVKKSASLRGQLNRLSKENQALKDDLEQLNKRLEELKMLDLQIEQKKRALH